MPARITIQSGIAAGTSHRIESRVARVGSDPQSDVCLPTANIPAHALTLEFRDDGCLVYNRCRDSVYIGTQAVEPDHVVEWPENDILQLGADIELQLDFEDAVSDEPYNSYGDDIETGFDEAQDDSADSEMLESQDGKTSSGGVKTAMQLAVTIVCLAGCALLLVRDQNRKSNPDTGPVFSEIITSATANPGVSRELIQRLQYAEAQLVRGRSTVAQDEFKSIRDDLFAQLDQNQNVSETPNSQILRFINERLTYDFQSDY